MGKILMKVLLFVSNLLFMSLLCFMCWQTWRSSFVGGEISRTTEKILSGRSSETGQIANWDGWLQKPNKGNAPQEPCGRVRGFCCSHTSSLNTFSTDIRWLFPRRSPELLLRGGPCYDLLLPRLQQAVQPQCHALCGHPTSLGSAHTELTGCPRTKSMKHSWVTPLYGGFPVYC